MSSRPFKTSIGIDKLVLYGFKCKGIRSDVLDADCNKDRVRHNSLPVEPSPTVKMVEHISIIDNRRFSELEIKVVQVPNRGLKTYVDLSLTVHHIRGNNLSNLSLNEYKACLNKIIQYIYETYGIQLDVCPAQVKYMEINCTFPLRHPFRDYDRVLRLWFNVVSGREKLGELNLHDVNNNNEEMLTETYSRGTSQMELVVYNKSSEMQKHDDCDVPDDLIRFEIRLCTPEKINRAFGTNSLAKIRDDMVADYFYGKMCDIDRGFKAWEKRNKEKIIKLVEEFRCPHEQWQLKLITYCLNDEIDKKIPLLLDIEDLKDAIHQDQYNHRARSIKSLDKHEEKASILFRGDREKEPEIMEEIKKAYQNSMCTYDGV